MPKSGAGLERRPLRLNDKTIEICERLDWSIYLDANEDGELRKESPAGEDFSICVDSKNFIQNLSLIHISRFGTTCAMMKGLRSSGLV